MNRKHFVFTALIFSAAFFSAPGHAAERIVSLGGDVTEIVYALGEGPHLACVDQTSMYPPEVHRLKQVGYLRTLTAEGVLSCKPDIILAAFGAGPKSTMDQLAAAKIPLVHVSSDDTPQAVLQKIDIIANALGVPQRGQALVARFRADMARTDAQLAHYTSEPRTLFLMAHGPGGTMAAGRHTAADAMLKLAKATNVGSGFDGYKPLTPEAAASLKPDVIIIDSYSLKSLGGLKAFRARPEIALTPAAQHGRIVALDTMFLLGFGPRTPQAISALAKAVHE